MPEIDGAYLVGYLWEMGPTEAAGDRQTILSHEEILAWQELIGIKLDPWEVRCVRRLSADYLSELHRAEKPGCPEPVRPEDQSGPDLIIVAKNLQQTLKELAKL